MSGDKKYGVVYSWNILDNNTIEKTVDKSALEHGGSGIPIEIRWFWGVQELHIGQKKYITVQIGDISYQIYIFNNDGRTRMFWNHQVSELINSAVRIVSNNDSKNSVIRFERIGKDIYNITFPAERRAAVAITDYDWYINLMQDAIPDTVNFWTPKPWNFKALNTGERLYFLSKKANGRRIFGYGAFDHYAELTAEVAWNLYGKANGVQSLDDMIMRIKKYTKGVYEGHLLGCIVLKDTTLFPYNTQKSPADYGWEIPDTVVKFKLVDDKMSSHSPINESFTNSNEFSLIQKGKQFKQVAHKDRKGQPAFRRSMLKIYNETCCISGEKLPDILEAAHIQEYVSEESNHMQNGLLLRVDLHRLFDNGFITIDDKYRIVVSSKIKQTAYFQYHGKKICLPQSTSYYPSEIALEWHNKNIFRP